MAVRRSVHHSVIHCSCRLRARPKMSDAASIIEHMFESERQDGVRSGASVAPVLGAPPRISASDAADGETPAAALWREATAGPEMIAQLASVSLQACTDSELL